MKQIAVDYPDATPTGMLNGISVSSIVATATAIAIGFLVLTPLVLLILSSFQMSRPGEPLELGLSGWSAALSQRGIQQALVNTVSLTIARLAIALVIGMTIAWILTRTDLPLRKWIEFGFWIGFFSPPVPVVLGWILLFDPSYGLANTALKLVVGIKYGPFNIFSWWGIVWAHITTIMIAVMVMLFTPIFRNMDASLEEVSRTCGASVFGTIKRVTIPLVAPALALAVVLSTIRLLESFEVEWVLGSKAGIDVYSTQIFRFIRFRDPPEFASAAALGLLIFVVMVPLAVLQHRISTRGSYTTLSGKFRSGLIKLGRWRWPIFIAVVIVLCTVTVIPVSLVVIGSFMRLFGFFQLPHPWTIDKWQGVFANPAFLISLKSTFIIAGGSALSSAFLFSTVGYVIARVRFLGAGILNFLTWVPTGIPGILLSLSLFWTFLNIPQMRPLFGTYYGLILAMTLANMTLGVQFIKANLLQIGNELEEAACMSGANWWSTFSRIILPLLSPGLVMVTMLSFANTTRNVSHVVLLGTGNTEPLSLLQLDYIAGGDLESASAVGVVMLLITTVVAFVMRQFGSFDRVGG